FARRAQARGATVLAADFGRAYLPRDRLTPLAAYDVPGQRVTEDTDVKHTTIWTLTERAVEHTCYQHPLPERHPRAVTTTVSHRCGQDHSNATLPWLPRRAERCRS